MSMYYRENGGIFYPEFGPGRTKQAFKDQCDINKMLKKAQVQGSIAHLLKYPEAAYGEFDGEFDLLTAYGKIEKAKEIFEDLPSEIRREHNNNPLQFVSWVNAPENRGKLAELLPVLAEPGNYFPNPVQRGGQGAAAATAPPEPPAEPTPAAPGTDPGVSPPEQV